MSVYRLAPKKTAGKAKIQTKLTVKDTKMQGGCDKQNLCKQKKEGKERQKQQLLSLKKKLIITVT